MGGVLGSLLVGVFAVRSVNHVDGLLAGNVKQFGLQCAGVAIVMAYAFAVTFGIFKVLDLRQTLYVPRQVQLKGLDAELHGETAYNRN